MDYMNLFYHLCDLNDVEIKSHIEDDTLNSWLHSWKNEIVKMFVKANDNNRPRPFTGIEQDFYRDFNLEVFFI